VGYKPAGTTRKTGKKCTSHPRKAGIRRWRLKFDGGKNRVTPPNTRNKKNRTDGCNPKAGNCSGARFYRKAMLKMVEVQ